MYARTKYVRIYIIYTTWYYNDIINGRRASVSEGKRIRETLPARLRRRRRDRCPRTPYIVIRSLPCVRFPESIIHTYCVRRPTLHGTDEKPFRRQCVYFCRNAVMCTSCDRDTRPFSVRPSSL